MDRHKPPRRRKNAEKPPVAAQTSTRAVEETAIHVNNDETLLTVVETAQFLRISRNLAYELVAQGNLPCLRIGRVIRVPRSSLIEWIRRNARAA